MLVHVVSKHYKVEIVCYTFLFVTVVFKYKELSVLCVSENHVNGYASSIDSLRLLCANTSIALKKETINNCNLRIGQLGC